MPAAAVIRKGQALFGIIGLKVHIGGHVGIIIKVAAQLRCIIMNHLSRVMERKLEFLV